MKLRPSGIYACCTGLKAEAVISAGMEREIEISKSGYIYFYGQNRRKAKKGKSEKTGEVVGKASKDVAEGTKSLLKGLKKGFGKKEEEK